MLYPSPLPRPLSRLRGFTLIELLVVISIIALLIGLLLPVLSGARASARQMQCTAKQRQIGIGYNLYAQDFDGRLNPTRLNSPQWWNGVVSPRPWYERLASIGPFSPQDYGFSFKERSNDHDFGCPAEERTFLYSSIGVNPFATGRPAADGVTPDPVYPYTRFSDFKIESEALLVIDNGRIPPAMAADYSVSAPDQAGYRHPQDNTVAVYADGHSVAIGRDNLTLVEFSDFLR